MRRRLAREIAVQSLYQMEMNKNDAATAIRTSIEEAENDNEGGLNAEDEGITSEYIHELVIGTLQHAVEIDEALHNFLKSWTLDRLSRVDRQILRLAAYEMIYRDDVPPKVVINEAIELAKYFGTEDSGKFVNGVLGKMIHTLEQMKQKLVR